MRIKIRFESYEIEARLLDTPTGKAIYEVLPIKNTVSTWGDEIYFGIPVQSDPEPGARPEVSVGDLALWPTMPAFCIFFGPTPASRNSTPVAASAVNVFGKLVNTDIDSLRSIRDGESVLIERLD